MEWRSIAVICPESDFGFVACLNGIATYARANRNWVLARRNPKFSQEEFRRRDIRGAICAVDSPRVRKVLAESGCTCVVQLYHSRATGCGLLRLDDHATGRLGARHLMACAYPRLGFYGSSQPWSLAREQGFVDRAEAASRACLTTEFMYPARRAQWHELEKVENIRGFLGRLQYPAGVMACNDAIATVLLREALREGLRVPDDLGLMGVDNDLIHCEFSPVPISSVATNLFQLGYVAAQMLARLMDGEAASATATVIPPDRIVVRRSTEALAIANPELLRAVKMIRSRACDGITVTEILQSVPMSRRQFERAFTEVIGHPPGEELRQLRLERARQLAKETDLKVDQIALRCGFKQRSHLSMAFKARYGKTISQTREEPR